MIRKIILCALLVTTFLARADEGMWLLPLIERLNMETMKKMGLTLDADDIYNTDSACLKDAVVTMNRGMCTAELISPEGLMLTNHHCGYVSIQHLSASNDTNYMKHGFWAESKKDELHCEGLTISILVRMDNVTDSVLAGVTDEMNEEEREKKINENKERIIDSVTDSLEYYYYADIDDFFQENQYYLSLYIEYSDVRLVGTPPDDLAKFGGDTDNWMWPRHTADFAVFRIYADSSNNPAEYDTTNIPYTPAHYLPLTLKGIQENNLTLIMGFPGRTDRNWTSYHIREQLTLDHPNRIKIRTQRQKIWREQMEKKKKIEIKYAAKYSRSSNYWKYSIGQSQWLKRLHVIERKEKTEEDFINWYSQDDSLKKEYGALLTTIRDNLEKRRNLRHSRQYCLEAIFRSADITDFAAGALDIYSALRNKLSGQALADVIEPYRAGVNNLYKNYDKETDRKIMAAMLELYYHDVDKQYHPAILQQVEKKYNLDFDEFTRDMYKKSIFSNIGKMNEFLDNPKLNKLRKDPAFQLSTGFLRKYQYINDSLYPLYDELHKAERKYTEGLMKMMAEKAWYPDANSTLRLTYGTIEGFKPRDAVTYNYYTTIDGVVEKMDNNNREFSLPDQFVELYENKDFGEYGDSTIIVNFISNNDITGGNSGSPVLNNKGELIGIAFDGNWESMSGDIHFEEYYQKAISVDIRYVLFIIDKYAHAGYLLDEMTIIK
jgi:hypothetical protein